MSRHQPHAVVNRNRSERVGGGGVELRSDQPMVNISSEHSLDPEVYELDGRLTLVQERSFQWKVPHTDKYVEVDLEAVNNPRNQLGPCHEYNVPIVTNNDPVSYRAAVNKRSNFIQTGPDDDLEDYSFAQAKSIINALPDLFTEWDENDIDRERWLSKFDANKRRRMEEAWLLIGEADKKAITDKQGSVKREVLLGKRFDKDAAGRIIYAGSDSFNSVTGPPMMIAMERLVELLASCNPDGTPVRVGEVEVLLGYKAQDTTLAAFISDERYPEIVEGDFSRNDREQRKRVADLCDLWFKKMGLPQWFRTLTMECEKYTLINFEFGLKVNLMYQLATGTTNTTFRNSIYNATMFAVCCRRQHRQGKALILGDDLLAALNHRLDLKAWVKDVATFKMVLKAKAPELDGEATFLSRRLFMNVPVPFMIPQPEKAYFRFNCRANPNQAMSDDMYISSKALSYAFSFRHVHMLRDLFLERWEMHGSHMDFDVTELGWNNRQFGYTVEDIYKKTIASPNLVEYYDLCLWVSKVYPNLDCVEFEEIMRDMICSREVVILDDARAADFAALVG